MNSVLVLNADFTKFNVTTIERAIKLVVKGKAEIIKQDDNSHIRSEKTFLKKPIIVRLFNYVSVKFRTFRISRNRIYKRDGNSCAYCGSHKDLTIDHIMPRSRGGRNEWVNLVTCCIHCNKKKGNKTPEEAGMKLLVKPYIPDMISEHNSLNDAWNEFMGLG